MELDSKALLLVAGGVTVLAFLLAAWLLPRTGRRWWGFLLRLVVMGVVSALVLTTGALYLNRMFHFYASWGDLFGTVSATTDVQQNGGASTAAVTQDVAGTGVPTAAAILPPLPSPGQRVQTYQVDGSRSGVSGRVLVIVPAGYEDAANAGRRYPVLSAYHGWPGSPEQYLPGGIDLQTLVDAQVAAGTMAPTVIVAPVINFPNGNTDNECVNGRSGQPQVETYLSGDVPAFVAAHLRIRTDRAAWSAFGFSTGGYCAAMLSMLHPDVFATSIVFGGYFAPDFASPYKPFGRADPEWANRYDLVAAAKRSPPPVAMWVESSSADPVSFASTQQFLGAVTSPLSVKSQIEQGVGHRVDLWAALTPTALAWLAQTSPDFRR